MVDKLGFIARFVPHCFVDLVPLDPALEKGNTNIEDQHQYGIINRFEFVNGVYQ